MWIHAPSQTVFTLHSEIRSYCKNTSFPEVITDDMLEALHIFPVVQTTPPAIDALTQRIEAAAPVLSEGVWTQQWTVRAATEAEQAEYLAQQATKKADKIEQLWQAADRYVTGYISGVAIGIMTIGVMQGKPKAQAISDWSNRIWTEYYRRKAEITADSVLDLDFSSFGPIPHTIPELQAEVSA